MRLLGFWVRVGDGFLQDLRVAIRVSLRTPMVTGLAVIACYGPASAAAKVSPSELLRTE